MSNIIFWVCVNSSVEWSHKCYATSVLQQFICPEIESICMRHIFPLLSVIESMKMVTPKKKSQ